MKNNKIFIIIYSSLFLVIAAILGSSCKRVGVNKPIDYGNFVFSGPGSSAQLVPTGTGQGTANFYAVYDSNLRTFNYTLTWKNLDSTVTNANFYGPNTVGQHNIILRNIYAAGSSAPRPHTDSLSFAINGLNSLSPSEVADLKSGKWYYVITTTSSPNGAIRGQINYVKTFYDE